jgi:tetratricopeptide (TPR) repeat protein
VAAQLSPTTAQLPQRSASSARARSAAASPVPQLGESRPKDFSFLLRPEIYHPLTPLNIPAAFRNSPKQPDASVPLPELLAKGHFRAAAIAAAQRLTGDMGGGGVDPHDAKTVFDLMYTRLACLTLIDATPLAAQEVKAFEDVSNAQVYVDDTTNEHLVPWELRVLVVRLQALGFSDPRRAVMSYHDLAREARGHIAKATAEHDNTARETWKARLHDMGLKVAGALIDMDDLSGAAHHLGTLRDLGDRKMVLAKALLWLRLGDAASARKCAAQCAGEAATTEAVILALCDMADGEYEAALARWKELQEAVNDEMVGVNAAVCLLYLGRLQEGRSVLEELVGNGMSSHTLLFNLSTMYELCTDRSRGLKLKLAERVAGLDETDAGWEKANVDFKL